MDMPDNHAPAFNEPQTEYEADCLTSSDSGAALLVGAALIGLWVGWVLLRRAARPLALLMLAFLSGCTAYKPTVNTRPRTLGAADRISAEPVTAAR